MHWIVIPYRGTKNAKSRLSGGMSETARRHVARAMFQHVLNVACSTVGPQRVLVVTRSASAAHTARRAGACALREGEPGLNAAVTQACASLRRRGALTATIIAADLPLLQPAHIEQMIARSRDGYVAVACDRGGDGTNAVALPLKVPFEFHFGERSSVRHLRQARPGCFDIRLVEEPGLASDLDVPADLDLLDDPLALSTLPAFAHRGLQ